MINFKLVLLSILFGLILINGNQTFAVTKNFSVLPDEQKIFDVVLNENQKVFFQIFVNGEETNDIHLKIIDDTNYVYFNSIIRQDKQDSEYASAIFPAYKNEISNHDTEPKSLTFIFDNTLSASNIKNVDFTFNVLTESGAYFEQTAFLDWIYVLVIIISVIVIAIVIFVIIIKKIKKTRN